MLKKAILAGIATAVLVGALVAVPVFAGNSNGGPSKFGNGYAPGWGCGDQNHIHTGPPGNPGAESPCKDK